MSQKQETQSVDDNTQENKNDDANTKEDMIIDQAELPESDHNDQDNDTNNETVKPLDAGPPPYTMKSVFAGLYCKDNMKDYRDKPKTKPLLLPFQDDNTWQLLVNTLDNNKNKQPNIAKNNSKSTQTPAELQYLSNLFQTLGNHKAAKLIKYLHLIRTLGTSSIPCLMDINKIGKKVKLSNQQNGQHIYQTFFNKTLPFIKKLILNMPKIFQIKSNDNENKNNDNDNFTGTFLNPKCNAKVSLTRGQVASILACCWFGIELYEHCSFHGELNSVGTPGKLECWIRYFDFVRQKGMNSNWFNKENVTVWRKCMLTQQCELLEYTNLIRNKTQLCDFNVFEEGCIEDQCGELHADFANQYIGGGVLEGGNVQEEIRFTVNTECIISKWLCPLPMTHNEAIIIFGSQQFFDYKGYGSSFCFNGYRNNKKEMFFCDNMNHRLGSSVIIGIDALYLFTPKKQIDVDFMMREIAKSFIGYSISNDDIGHKMDVVSTGNWGCGIFRGDPQLKAMLQWISVSLSGRSVAYYTFKDRRVANGLLGGFMKQFNGKKITVGNLWKVLVNPQFAQDYKGGESVIDLLSAEFK
eukprot:211398_1